MRRPPIHELFVVTLCRRVPLASTDESDVEGDLQQHAIDLYGLIHARYIVTSRGLDAMVKSSVPFKRAILLTPLPLQLRKYRTHEFGVCPAVNCRNAPVVPVS